ncbi:MULTISPECIES: hypothetical protein [Cyanophyceae]|uniref:ATPase n=1 Tax=Leptolyngbya subtilissima DQ-A4 TaxID=2933933 RepID=A0ABV0KC44_9CYAN|nr:hypothetical protein [Nodosilinea sp. FACHB-141]MBD2114917.1 hypothetical protein [Nodosilinea sp. FACHB-141]
MTQSSDRLDRMEALLATTIEGLARTEKITESNARAIEAWGGRIDEGDQKNQTQLEASIADTVAMIADMGQQQQEAAQRAEQHKVEADQRFEVFLAEARADRQRSEQLNAEHNQRFETFLQDARADRQRFDQTMAANATEHRAFRETLQNMLAEIARLWQRVAG